MFGKFIKILLNLLEGFHCFISKTFKNLSSMFYCFKTIFEDKLNESCKCNVNLTHKFTKCS